jgi:GT2 family glycosyltransferase
MSAHEGHHPHIPADRSRVTAAIATYNGRGLLEVVLPSLERQSYRDFCTVVVDDCSTDESVRWLRERWPAVKVIVHPENRGVTRALNTCIAAGIDSEFVLLLNNDVELDERCVELLVGELEAHPEAAVAGAKMRDYRRRELLDGTGDVYTWAGFAYRRGQGEIDCGQYDEVTEVFGACGAVALYRKAAFERVGPFDERFYALCEDTDWAFRARLLGYSSRYVPTAIAYHVGSASLGPRLSEFTLYHNWRNQIWTILKDYPGEALLRHTPDLLLGQLAMLAVAVRHRCLGQWLRAWRDALRGLSWVLGERARIQRTRRRDRRALEPVVESGFARARWWLRGSGRQTSAAARAQPRAASER